MFQIDNIFVDEAIIKDQFICNISACKGACCVKGDGGAPLKREEALFLENNYEKIKPFITPEGISSIEENGHYVSKYGRALFTPLIPSEALPHQEDKPCAYINYENGIAVCGIEKAHEAGEIEFQKPVSCHLYPIRVEEKNNTFHLRYDIWDICSAACEKGKSEQVAIFEFLREPIIREFGADLYEKLELAKEFLENQDQ